MLDVHGARGKVFLTMLFIDMMYLSRDRESVFAVIRPASDGGEKKQSRALASNNVS